MVELVTVFILQREMKVEIAANLIPINNVASRLQTE